MTFYDDIYHRVQEMNRDWRRQVAEIRTDVARTRAGAAPRPASVQTVSIIAGPGQPELGQVTVDQRGDLKAINLDAYAVHGMYSEHVATAIVTAINKAIKQAGSAGIGKGPQ